MECPESRAFPSSKDEALLSSCWTLRFFWSLQQDRLGLSTHEGNAAVPSSTQVSWPSTPTLGLWGILTCVHSALQPLLFALGFCTHFPLSRTPSFPSFQPGVPLILTSILWAPTHPGFRAMVAFSLWVVISWLFVSLTEPWTSQWLKLSYQPW